AGPALEGGARGIDRGLGIFHGCAGDRGDLVLGRGIENVETAAVGGFAPFAADPQIGRNVGKKIFIHGTLPMMLEFHTSTGNGDKSVCHELYLSPPAGRGRERSERVRGTLRIRSSWRITPPPPPPPPPRGGGAPRARRGFCSHSPLAPIPLHVRARAPPQRRRLGGPRRA